MHGPQQNGLDPLPVSGFSPPLQVRNHPAGQHDDRHSGVGLGHPRTEDLLRVEAIGQRAPERGNQGLLEIPWRGDQLHAASRRRLPGQGLRGSAEDAVHHRAPGRQVT